MSFIGAEESARYLYFVFGFNSTVTLSCCLVKIVSVFKIPRIIPAKNHIINSSFHFILCVLCFRLFEGNHGTPLISANIPSCFPYNIHNIKIDIHITFK